MTCQADGHPVRAVHGHTRKAVRDISIRYRFILAKRNIYGTRALFNVFGVLINCDGWVAGRAGLTFFHEPDRFSDLGSVNLELASVNFGLANSKYRLSKVGNIEISRECQSVRLG